MGINVLVCFIFISCRLLRSDIKLWLLAKSTKSNVYYYDLAFCSSFRIFLLSLWEEKPRSPAPLMPFCLEFGLRNITVFFCVAEGCILN